jgi:hypothetical protein
MEQEIRVCRASDGSAHRVRRFGRGLPNACSFTAGPATWSSGQDAAFEEFVSGKLVRELTAGKGFLFNDRGESTLKGFEDPVRLYEVPWNEDDVAAGG